MNSTSASDSSLYEIALGSDQQSLVLQVSPATLKSVVSSFMDLLIEQKMPAVVWAKLPRGDIWQVELERYSLLNGISRGIYQFRNYRDDSGNEAGMVSSSIAPDSDAENPVESTNRPILNAPETIVPIQLAPESQLRREYFLLVWSTQFQALVLAHRPRSAHLAKAVQPAQESDTPADSDYGAEDNQEKRQHLLALCSFDSGLILRVLGGLERAVTVNQQRQAEGTQIISTPQPSNLISQATNWRRLIAEMPVAPLNLLTLGQLFTRQIQRQEELSQRNATYRKQAEAAESLQLHNEELTTTIRLKDDFLNNVGQELRTPLTTIKTALTLLNSPNIKPPQRQRYMDLIAKECDRQSSLITSLLDLVQLEQVPNRTTFQPIQLAEVVPGVVTTYQPLAEEKGIKLVYTIPEGLPPISCMRNWLKQIVINLLHNGIKFTPSGGQVWVRAKQQGEYVQLEFRDTGVGISTNEVPKIFERFYRVRQSSEETSSGAGLGLTIVQQLLIHCGGSISVKSKPGEGSTFTVLLPVNKPRLEDRQGEE